MTGAPRLELAQLPTPLQRLERLSEHYQREIWVKRDDLTGHAVSGNKIRKLEYSLAQARQEQAQVVITCGGLQSNHCRATAILCANLGLKCHLLLRGEEPNQADGNLFLDQLAGAEISYFAPRYYAAHLDFIAEETCENYRKKGVRPFFIPTGASDAIGVWGYYQAAKELAEDFEREGLTPDAVISATGSGGTQAGLTAGMAQFAPDVSVIGYAVCDDADWFTNKVDTDLTDWADRYGVKRSEASRIQVRDQYIGDGYAIASPAIFETIRELLRLEGILLDPVYTGKAFYGMLCDLQAGELPGDGPLVFVHTGGSFGLFAQRPQALSALQAR